MYDPPVRDPSSPKLHVRLLLLAALSCSGACAVLPVLPMGPAPDPSSGFTGSVSLATQVSPNRAHFQPKGPGSPIAEADTRHPWNRVGGGDPWLWPVPQVMSLQYHFAPYLEVGAQASWLTVGSGARLWPMSCRLFSSMQITGSARDNGRAYNSSNEYMR